MMTKIEVAEWMPPRFARRAEHFYGEHKRVREGITAWETGNLEWFGSLSKASCDSSIHNYECGSPELQAIYQAMLTTDGIYGGRFSGAGFKGACIALVDPAKKESIEQAITEKYLRSSRSIEIRSRCISVRVMTGRDSYKSISFTAPPKPLKMCPQVRKL